MFRRNLIGYCGLGGIGDFARDHTAVANDDGDLGRAVIEHQAAGVEPIVRLGRLPVGHAAVDGDGKLRRRDVLSVSAGAKPFRLFLGRRGRNARQDQHKSGQRWNAAQHSCHPLRKPIAVAFGRHLCKVRSLGIEPKTPALKVPCSTN